MNIEYGLWDIYLVVIILFEAIEHVENKSYYVVGDAGFARPRNTLKIISNFF